MNIKIKLNLKILLFFYTVTNICQAQYKILYLDGIVLIKNNSKWSKCDLNSLISENSVLKVNKLSKISIINNQYGGTTLNSGIFTINKTLFPSIQSEDLLNLSKKYFSILWDKITEHHEDLESYKHYYMVKKGAVSRDGAKYIQIYPAWGETIIFEESLKIKWKNERKGTIYNVSILDSTGKEIFSNKTTDLSIDVPKFVLNTEGRYSCSIIGETQCINSPFVTVPIDKFKNVESQIETDLREINDNIIKTILKCHLLESKGFFLESSKYYLQLLKEYPNYKGLKNQYISFKARVYGK